MLQTVVDSHPPLLAFKRWTEIREDKKKGEDGEVD